MIDHPGYISESNIKMTTIQLSGAWNEKIWDLGPLIIPYITELPATQIANDKGSYSCYTPFKINVRSII